MLTFGEREPRVAAWVLRLSVLIVVGAVLQDASASPSSLLQVAEGTTSTSISSSSAETAPKTYASVVGESVTYTAAVSDLTRPAADTGQTPTGTVDFTDESDTSDPVVLCDDVVLSGSQASCVVAPAYASPAVHTITATYSGDGDFQGSQDSLTQNVHKADTSIDVQSSDTTSNYGQSVTFTANVSVDSPGAGAPTGSVDFSDGGTGISECSGATAKPVGLNSTTNGYEATCTLSNLAVGDHSITAAYGGDSNFNSSSTGSPLAQTVEKADTSTGVSSSDLSAKTGQAVTFTAVVLPIAPGTGTPTGTVTFIQDGNAILACSDVVLSAGEAKCSQTYSSVGDRVIAAEYSGDGEYNGSTSSSITQVVTLPYTVTASLSGRSSEPTNAKFRVRGGSPRSYTLCVRLLGTWRSGPREYLRTPEPVGGEPGEKWATKWTLNTHDRCRGFTWRSKSSSTKRFYPHLGWSAKGTYQATLKMDGDVVDTATISWNSWCPPSGLRNTGVWRPSRLKAIDSCKASSGYVGKGGNRSRLDADLGWRWMSRLGRLHVEYVAMDSGWYSNPTTGKKPLLRSPGGAGKHNRWTLWGKYVCDTYHGWKEFHRVYMARQGNAIFISGAQYSTKTPRVSGTWSAHKC